MCLCPPVTYSLTKSNLRPLFKVPATTSSLWTVVLYPMTFFWKKKSIRFIPRHMWIRLSHSHHNFPSSTYDSEFLFTWNLNSWHRPVVGDLPRAWRLCRGSDLPEVPFFVRLNYKWGIINYAWLREKLTYSYILIVVTSLWCRKNSRFKRSARSWIMMRIFIDEVDIIVPMNTGPFQKKKQFTELYEFVLFNIALRAWTTLSLLAPHTMT